ncbi:MAG: hypothetical protein KatS3mg130_0598 [Candidatus Sumerlaea sp.]|uniref:Uncharacterized protein n=1 Tax=Sumerlaea chitinivorans TaxID=2250252 RepID=A0A2Z4Y4F0_SUMC1|nr:hypothetical protein BRCON_1069 [Candidatus Sumerlaea chitinivorans]MCX7963963.1 hypothetical protein [Candidatus Sumerlaea chitinivorans]GIX44190.1 MAG: hypothetical protein KatS3mg130_0598 [Candidatus Sumerlaea sp.]
MTYKKGKQQFTKEEIIEILKRNVNLFKDEEEFVDYIVELALYLVEHRMQTQTDSAEGKGEHAHRASESGPIEKRIEPFRRSGISDIELHDLLRQHTREPEIERVMCRVCGAFVPKSAKTCPMCASLIG